MSNADLFDTIDCLYEAALLPAAWAQALERTAHACGGIGITVSLGQIPEPALANPVLEASTAAYAATWWQRDSRTPRLERAFRGRPVTNAELFTDEERRRDPFHQEFLRAHGLFSFAGVIVRPLPGLSYVLNLEGGPEPFDRDQLDTFALLSRHLSRALAATARLELSEAFSGDLANALEHTACAVVFLGPDGRVIFMNERAEQMLGPDLTLKDGILRSSSPREQAALDALIARTLPGSPRANESVFLSRAGGRSPLMVQGVPLPSRPSPCFERLGISSGGGLLLLHDLSADRPRSVTPDLQQMGLTPAQARVAELIGSGLSPREAAREVGIVESTARAQLKHAYARLGISRQSELAILVTNLRTIKGRIN